MKKLYVLVVLCLLLLSMQHSLADNEIATFNAETGLEMCQENLDQNNNEEDESQETP